MSAPSKSQPLSVQLRAALSQAKYAIKLADRFANRVAVLERRLSDLERRKVKS